MQPPVVLVGAILRDLFHKNELSKIMSTITLGIYDRTTFSPYYWWLSGVVVSLAYDFLCHCSNGDLVLPINLFCCARNAPKR
ncbi:bicyclomycin/multidrug efflux system, partial [Pasteurella multocida subsp. multocida str. Anand1_cattle]